MYRKGKGGIKVDYKLALYWFKKSAEQGTAEAQEKIGLIYEKGLSGEQDFKQVCDNNFKAGCDNYNNLK